MSQIVLTEELIKRAVALSHDRWINKYYSPEKDEEHVFPEGFYEHLVQYMNRRKHIKSISRGVVAAVLVLLAAGTILLASSPTARAAVFSWVKEVFRGHTIYHYQESSPLTEVPHYMLSYIPEGFEEVDGLYNSITRSTFYFNSETNESFLFECRLLLEGNHKELLISESTIYESVTVNGIKADFYQADELSDTNNLIWFDESKRVVFYIDSALDQSVMLHIAEGVVLEDSTK